MRVFLVTADEPFYIPIFLENFLKKLEGELVGCALLPPHPKNISFRKYIHNHYKLYGLRAFLRMGVRYVQRKHIDRFLRFLGFDRPPSVKSLLKEYDCPIYEPSSVNNKKFLNTIGELGIDLVVSVAASQIFKSRILNLPNIGCINMHGSLLPKHRGINPSFWALLAGDKETGISVHFMDESIDTGKIVLQRSIPIDEDETLDSLSKKIAEKGAHVLVEAMDLIEQDGGEVAFEQEEGEGSYHSFPTKEDGKKFRDKGLKFI